MTDVLTSGCIHIRRSRILALCSCRVMHVLAQILARSSWALSQNPAAFPEPETRVLMSPVGTRPQWLCAFQRLHWLASARAAVHAHIAAVRRRRSLWPMARCGPSARRARRTRSPRSHARALSPCLSTARRLRSPATTCARRALPRSCARLGEQVDAAAGRETML